MVQPDASDHDWLEGRDRERPRLALVGVIGDAAGLHVRFKQRYLQYREVAVPAKAQGAQGA